MLASISALIPVGRARSKRKRRVSYLRVLYNTINNLIRFIIISHRTAVVSRDWNVVVDNARSAGVGTRWARGGNPPLALARAAAHHHHQYTVATRGVQMLRVVCYNGRDLYYGWGLHLGPRFQGSPKILPRARADYETV